MPYFLSGINLFRKLWGINKTQMVIMSSCWKQSSSFHSSLIPSPPLLPLPAVPLYHPWITQGTVEAHCHRLTDCLLQISKKASVDALFWWISWDYKQRPRVPIWLLLFAFGWLFSLSLVLPWTWVFLNALFKCWLSNAMTLFVWNLPWFGEVSK